MDKLSDLERLEALANNVSDYESSSDDNESETYEDNDVEDTLADDKDPRDEASAGKDIGIIQSKQNTSVDSVQIVGEDHILEAIDTGQSENDIVTDNTDVEVYNETIEKDPLADNSNHAIDIPITLNTTSENSSDIIDISSEIERDPLNNSLDEQMEEEIEAPVTRNIEAREDKRVGRAKEINSDHNNKLVDLFLSVEPIVNMSRDLEEEDDQEEEEEEGEDDQSGDENDELEAQIANKGGSLEEIILDEELDVMDAEEAAMLEDMVEDASKLISDESSGEGDDAGEDVDKIASDEEEEREEEGIDQEHTEEGDPDSDPDPDEDENVDDDEEDNAEEFGDDEDLEPNIENLLLQNTNYKDFLKNVLAELTTELQNNQRRQNELEILMQDKEQELRMIIRKPTKHISVVKKSLTIFGFPYFKDVQMFYPPPNKDVLTKRKQKELDVYVEVPKLWSPMERRDMLNACRKEALYKRFFRIFDEKEEIERQMKMIGVTDIEKEILEEKLRAVTFDLKTGSNISNAELFADRNYEYDWMAISKKLTGSHDPTECRLQWLNLVHPSINRAPWTFEEDELLKQLAEATDCREWDDIAAEIGSGRTAIACFKRFMQKHIPLNKVYCWNRKEDDRLKRLVEHTRIQFYIPWSKVHYYMPGRTKDQCNQRYMNSLRDGIRNGLWTEPEEWVLIAGQTLYNGDGLKVSEILPTRSNMQIYCHWGNYMKGDYRPWSNEEDITLLEAVKNNGIKNWAKVAEVFNDESRNRTRCRHRFEAIYRLFEKFPSTGLDNMIDLDTNKQAAKRRAAAYSSFEKKFESWAQRMNLEPVLTNIPVQHVDLNAKTKLPNGTVVQNRTLSRFIRHLQTLLPKPQPIKLDRPVAPILRRFPDQVVDPLPLRPLQPKRTSLKRPKRLKKPVVPMVRMEKVAPVKKNSSGKSIMDHKITRLFRPAMLIPRISTKHRYDENTLATLSIATKNLDLALDFSSVKNNLDEEKISKFSRGEQQILESYRFHTDITDKHESPPLQNNKKSSRKARATYRNKLKQNNTESEDPQSNNKPMAVDRISVLPANLTTLRMLRGCLLHADYTATIARNIEKGRGWSFIQNNTVENKCKVLRHGIKNPDILARNLVGKTLFTPVSKATSEELEENTQQVIADKKLVDRLVKLLFLPAKMSINTPENHQDLFDDLDDMDEVNDTVDLEPPFEGSEQAISPLPTDTSAVDMSTDNENLLDNHDDDVTGGSASDRSSSSLLRIRKLSSLQEQPLNLSMNLSRSPSTKDDAGANRSHNYANVPSVLSMSNPPTPATRTYSRKRKGTRLLSGNLVINFNELLSSSQEKRTKKAPKMTDIIREKSKSNPSAPVSSSSATDRMSFSSSTSDNNSFSSLQGFGSDSSIAPQQNIVILPNIPAHITPVTIGTIQQLQVRPLAKPQLSVIRVHPGKSGRSPFLPGHVVTSMPPPPAPQPSRMPGISEFFPQGPSGYTFQQPAARPSQPGTSNSGQPLYRMPRMRLPSRNDRAALTPHVNQNQSRNLFTMATATPQQEVSLQEMALRVALDKAQQQNFAERAQLPPDLEQRGSEPIGNLHPVSNTFLRLLMANNAQNMQQPFFPPSQFPPSDSNNTFQ